MIAPAAERRPTSVTTADAAALDSLAPIGLNLAFATGGFDEGDAFVGYALDVLAGAYVARSDFNNLNDEEIAAIHDYLSERAKRAP